MTINSLPQEQLSTVLAVYMLMYGCTILRDIKTLLSSFEFYVKLEYILLNKTITVNIGVIVFVTFGKIARMQEIWWLKIKHYL